MSGVNNSMDTESRKKLIIELIDKSKGLETHIAKMEYQREFNIQEIKKKINDLLTA